MANTFGSLYGVPFDVKTGVYEGTLDDRYAFEWMKSYRVGESHAHVLFCFSTSVPFTPTDSKRVPYISECYISSPTTRLEPEGTGYALPPSAVNASNEDQETGEEHEDKSVSFTPSLRRACLEPSSLGRFLYPHDLAGIGQGLAPTWSDVGFGGAEQFWKEAWPWMEDPEFSNDEYSDRPVEWDFLVSHSKNCDAFEGILSNPPLLASKAKNRSGVAPSSGDFFAQILFKVLENSLELFPTASVKIIRIRSRAVAYHGLSNSFWKSRFGYPHETSHIPRNFLANPPESSQIDLKALRQVILQPAEEESLMYMDEASHSRRNRKRIFNIARELRVAIFAIISQEASLAPFRKCNEYDFFARYPYQRNTVSCGVLLTTNRDRLEIFGCFKIEQIVEIVICTE